jgi:hypothetical protein
MRKWRNWQTRYLEGVVGNAHAGSIPAFRTKLERGDEKTMRKGLPFMFKKIASTVKLIRENAQNPCKERFFIQIMAGQ